MAVPLQPEKPQPASGSRPAALIDMLAPYVSARKQARIGEVLPWRTRYLRVVLEDIYQTQNASAVIRSCDLFGIQQVEVIEKRNRFKVNKAVAQGASKWVDISRHTADGEDPTVTCLTGLRRGGYTLAAFAPGGADCSLEELSIDRPLALLFGGEEAGLSKVALEMADYRVSIPMAGFSQSFNLSVSVALALQSLTLRLRDSDRPWQLPDDEALQLKLRWYAKSAANGGALLRQFERRLGGE